MAEAMLSDHRLVFCCYCGVCILIFLFFLLSSHFVLMCYRKLLLLLLLQWLLAKRLRIMLNAYSFSQLSMMVRPCGVSTLSG